MVRVRTAVFARLATACYLVSFAVVGSNCFAEASPDPDTAQPASAIEIYRQACARCHGENGQGKPDGYDKAFLAYASDAELAQVISETMPEDDPESCVGEDALRLAKLIRVRFPSRAETPSSQISRLTVDQYRNSVADLIASFPRESNENLGSSYPEVPGLRGEYYQSRGMNKANQLGHYSSDTYLDFDFGDAGPVPSISADQFAIVWEGGLRAEHSGTYEFRVRTPNGARLYINLDPSPARSRLRDDSSQAGQQALIDAWVGSGNMREKAARVDLLGGRTYPIRIEFFKYLEDNASITVQWKPPHGVWSVIDYNHTLTSRPARTFVSEAPFPADDRSLGFERGSSASPRWQAATMQGATQAATEVVDRLPYLAALDDAENRVARVRDFMLEFAETAYRQPLDERERELVLGLVGNEDATLESGVRRAVILILMSPKFLYPELTPTGRPPTQFAIASRLSFALWDSIPDAKLYQAAKNGELATLDQVRGQARRMIQDPRTKAKVRGFFRSWLEIEDRDLAKDKQLFPQFDEAVIADLRRSLELFIDNVVWSRESDYRQLLLADYLMLNRRLRALYRVGDDGPIKPDDGQEIKRRAGRRQFASAFQPVDFPPERRSGVLTHPYLLSAYAYHNNSSPIHRGVFLTRNIVGRALSPPPNAIAFKDEDFSPELTMREKVTQLTRDTACMSCHSVINPLGFALENFDAVGRWRELENDKPVDSKSDYTTASGKTVQISGARDIADVAAESTSAHHAFVTHVFEHLVKQSPQDFDDGIVSKIGDQFREDDFNIQKLWAHIASIAAIKNAAAKDLASSDQSPQEESR